MPVVQQQEILTVQPFKESSHFYQQIPHSTTTANSKTPFKFWSLKEKKNPSCVRRAKLQMAETLEPVFDLMQLLQEACEVLGL